MARVSSHQQRVAAVLGGPQQDQNSSGQRRNIPKDHAYDPRSLKPMAKAMWAATVSLGHALAAYRHFSRLKSATISPDGLLGGRGYVMPIQDVRQKLYDACEALSSISDTLYDEIQAPHWKPRLAMLDENEVEDIQRFVEESQETLEHPDEEAEERIEEIESENDDDAGSELPNGGAAEGFETRSLRVKEASHAYTYDRRANSSLPVGELSGPRVDHIGPGEGDGPYGSYNPSEDATSDDWGLDEGADGEYDYVSPWDNELRQAQSVLPEDPTETQAWDFGLGYGGRGQALERSNPGADGRGVWGPSSALPGSLAQLQTLPNDDAEPVARSDYYEGPKGNLVQAEDLSTYDYRTYNG